MSDLIYTREYANEEVPTKDTKDSGIYSGLSEEEFKRLLDECEYRPIPERIEESKTFIELAIRYSEENRTTVEIMQRDEDILVCYYFNSLISYGDKKDALAELIKRSDSFDIFLPAHCENKTIKLVLSFKTHEFYKRWEFL